MSPFRFLLLMAIPPVFLCVLYLVGFVYQLGAPYPAQYWIGDSLVVKREILARAAKIPEPRLMILGGSSAWFGLDSKVLQATLGMPTFNLSLGAALPIEYYLELGKTSLRPGDVAVIAFEYEYYYSRPTPYTPDFTDQLLTWQTDYFRSLPLCEQIKVVAAVPWYRVIGGVLTVFWGSQIAEQNERKGTPSDFILRFIEAVWKGEVRDIVLNTPYHFALIDEHGDHTGLLGPFLGAGGPDFSRPFISKVYPWNVLAQFAEWCRTHQIHVLVVWSPSLAPPDVDFHTPSAQAHVAAIRSRFLAMGLSVLDQPEHFQYDRFEFGDGYYHLAKLGRKRHTQRIAQVLKAALLNQGILPGAPPGTGTGSS